MEKTLDKLINNIKRFVFATYDTDRRLFKVRNRIMLLTAITFIVKISISSPENIVEETHLNAKGPLSIEVKKKHNIKTSSNYDWEEIDTEVTNEEVKAAVIEAEQASEKEYDYMSEEVRIEEKPAAIAKAVSGTFINPYKILLMTFTDKKFATDFAKKYAHLNVKIKNTHGSKWISYLGPYEGYSAAKSDLNALSGEIPKDSYISK